MYCYTISSDTKQVLYDFNLFLTVLANSSFVIGSLMEEQRFGPLEHYVDEASKVNF